jgi:hypothetical protein
MNAIGREQIAFRVTEFTLARRDDIVHFDKTFLRYEEAGDGKIEAHFEDGMAITCDLLMADQIRVSGHIPDGRNLLT